MEDAEKMLALKKAYAEIILNTSKEAAARIMASERKALRFQHDLRSTKEEALRMLLRFKQTINAKNTEVEITSLNQQRKIEELEAQLSEAEGMILDLRAELKQMHDQMDRVKKNEVQPSFKLFETEEVPSNENAALGKKQNDSEHFVSSISGLKSELAMFYGKKSSSLGQEGLERKCSKSANQVAISNSQVDDVLSDSPDFASIIMKRKEPNLYKNGCTQRIHAIERSPRDEKFPPSDVDDQHFLLKRDSVFNGSQQDTGTFIIASSKNANVESMATPTGVDVLCVTRSAMEDQPIRMQKMRKRKTRYGKAKATSCKLRHGQSMKRYQPSLAYFHGKRLSHANNNNVKSGEGVCTQPSAEAGNSNIAEKSCGYKDQAVSNVRRSLRKRKVKNWDDYATSYRTFDQITQPCQPYSFLSRCKTGLVNCNIKSAEDHMESIASLKVKTNIDPMSASTDLIISTNGSGESGTGKDSELTDLSVLVKQDGNAAESSGFLSFKSNHDLTDSHLRDAKTSDAISGASCQIVNNRLLKYTFCRKRKKEYLVNRSENSSLGENSIKGRVGERQIDISEPQNFGPMEESSRDNRRLVQVARQLISLSGKRRW